MSALGSPLNHGHLAAAVRSGTPTLGTFIGAAAALTAEVCAAAGVDWVLLDLEHGGGGEEQVRDVVPAAGSYGVPTVVRVESAARIRIGRVLDQGAAGIMLPRLEAVDDVAEAVRHLRYPPAGDRGVATYNRACRFGLDPGALDRANDEILGVVQIESAAAARAGKPFWIEKPVGRDVADTAAVAAAAREAGVATSIGYNYRHVPAVERVRELIAAGELGRITNVRAVFFNSYAAEPNGALSWRFRRAEAGSGALGDLLSHVVDLMQYVVAPITEVSSLLSTVYARRPILPMGSATHFAVIENGEMGEVENDDYVAALVRFAGGAHAAGAVGTLEASRVSVGPQCGLGFEIYGTDGSAAWNFEQMNELRLCLGRGDANTGYTTVLGNSHLGDYARFQPGPGHSMGYDDLKVIEARKFLVAVAGGEQRNSTIAEALADAEVIAATAASARDGAWHSVAPVPAATFGHA